MAESQTSPDAVASPGTETAKATGNGDATRSDSVTTATSQSQPSNAELDEITRTVSAGGEKAVEIVKHWQRVASEKDGRLAPYKKIEDLFKTLGGGDVAKGAEAAEMYLTQYNAVVSNPDARDAVSRLLETGEWKPKGVNQDNFDFDDEDEADPVVKRLEALERQTNVQSVKAAKAEMRGYMDGFFKTEMTDGISFGEILNDEEKSKILSGLEGQLKNLASNESGRATLQNLSAPMVQQMMQLQITPDQWVSIGERAHLQKIERKRGAATGAVPTGGTTGNESRTYGGDLAQQVADFAKEQGIDLYNLTGKGR